ncbi:MAG: hypothetical protein AAF519_07845 [Bacteroidota bacterium]
MEERIPFYIRIKNNTLVEHANGKIKKAYCFFAGQKESIPTNFKIGKDRLNLPGKYLGKGEYVIVANNATVKYAPTIYRERWQREMFYLPENQGLST